MHDPAHVGFVDAHAEGDGGDHDPSVLSLEAGLSVGAQFRIETCVIGLGGIAHSGQALGRLLRLLARAHIDDAGGALRPRCQEAVELAQRLALFRKVPAQIRAVEAADQDLRLGHLQLVENVRTGLGVRRGGQRDPRHRGEPACEGGEPPILGAEVVPPLRHAVRFVDGDQRDLATLQQLERSVHQQPLGRDVEQAGLPAAQALQHRAALPLGQGRVQHVGDDAGLAQLGHLVGHQGDQRRNHNGDTGAAEGGNLIAGRFAEAGRRDDQSVAPL